MRISNIKFVFFALFVFLNFARQLQSQNFNFKHLSTSDGLSSNEVRAVFEDSNGFMWFATSDGLNRWDGYEFEVYKNFNNEENSLPTNFLLCLAEDADKNIWIGTNHGGLAKYNTTTETFHRYAMIDQDKTSIPGMVVRSIHVDSNNNIWIGTHSGLAKYDGENDRFIRFSFPIENPNKIFDIRAIFQSAKDQLTIQSDQGFFTLELSTEKIDRLNFNAPKLDKELFMNNNPVCFDSNGYLWIGSRIGLFKLNLRTGEHKRYESGKHLEKSINSNSYSVIFEDSRQNIWIGTENRGVNLYNANKDEFTSFTSGSIKGKSISNNIVSNIYEDHNSNVWFSTLEGGVSFFSSKNNQFEYYVNDPSDANSISSNKIGAFSEDKDGFLWIGTEDGGLNKFSPESRVFERYSLNTNFIAPSVLDIEPINQNTLFLTGLRTGLYKFDIKSGKFTNMMENTTIDNTKIQHITDLSADLQGNIWMSTHGKDGIIVYESATKQFFDANSPGSYLKELLSIPYVVSIKQDSKNRLWLVTYLGLYMFDTELHKYNSIKDDTSTISSNYLYVLYEDSENNIWLGSSKGLDRLIEENNSISFERYSDKHSLPSNVKGILEDSEGNLWLSSNRGITKFNPKTNTTRDYRINNELDYQEISERVCFKSSNGEMYFGGTSGFVRFNPQNLKEMVLPSNVKIVDFQILNTSQKVNSSSVLKKSIIYTKEIELDYKKSIFSFEFAALDFRKQGNVQYAYMLEGFDKNWNFSGDKRFAAYTNLSPGQYTFRVKTTDGNILSDGEGASVFIKIHPPAWRTTYAYAFYFLLLAGILYFFRRSVINRERLRTELQLEKKEINSIHEANIMKHRFFTNISHEFRTPLTLIKAPVEKLIKSGGQIKQEEQQFIFQLIQSNTNKLLRMVNQLLDYRKLEAGSLMLEPSEGDIVDFCRKTWGIFNLLAEQKNMKYVFQTTIDSQIMSFDADKIDKIITNLLSNAFKYTPEGGQIILSVEKVNDAIDENINSTQYMRICVADSGIGIPENEIDQVFDRFYTLNHKGFEKFEGTGIGLTLVKELTQLHKGQIFVKSVEQKGSEFEVKIPIIIPEKTAASAEPENTDTENGKVVFTGDDIDRIIEGKPLSEDTKKIKNKILIIEDDDELRMFLRNELLENFEVIQATNGLEGLDMVFAHNPDLVVSDIMMPHMDGIEFCKKLKSDERSSHIPVILLSALHSQEKQIEGLEHGADDYIFKPFNVAILVSRIRNLLNTRLELGLKFKNNTSLKFENDSANDADKNLIQAIIDIVLENITNEKINADFIAKKILISRSVIYIKVEALTGQTVNEFIRNIRLKKSTALLEQQDCNITEVAYAVGFSSQSYFTRCFTKRFGTSPKNYSSKQLRK